MELYLAIIVVLVFLAVFDLMVGVSNDAVNFLNSPIGSRVASRHVIMIVASLGMLAGVTVSGGMMEVARKGIFHPQLFSMPDLLTIFLAVMLTDVLLLDMFNTFGLPTSTTVSIVFALLGSAVVVSLIKINAAGLGFEELVNYINTGKALAIISGILLSIVIAFICGVVIQLLSRLLFTFDYMKSMKIYGGLWGGLALMIIIFFILTSGVKEVPFLSADHVIWIENNYPAILVFSFVFFGLVFQLLASFTRVNIFKPIVILGTFALAMAFAANDLVNFIGVPMAGLQAYKIAAASADPLHTSMAALQQKIPTSTFLLLCAGVIMIATLWISKKARTVTETQVNLSRQDEGAERFGSFPLSRAIVGMFTALYDRLNEIIPPSLKSRISKRLDPSRNRDAAAVRGKEPAFDLLRASVNLIVASAVVSYGTSMQLPLSTTYVTFMVAMGSSLSDQAWGRESAVYRITGVLAVIAGWFCTAIVAFTIAAVFAFAIFFLKIFAVVGLIILAGFIITKSFRYHAQQEKVERVVSMHIKDGIDADHAVNIAFEQTGYFLNEVSTTLRICLDALFTNDGNRLREVKDRTRNIQKVANIIIANIFKTLYLLDHHDVEYTRKYSRTVRALQEITESHRDIVMRSYTHVINYHSGLVPSQIDELKKIRLSLSRLLENTAIMLQKNKTVDYDYIENQRRRLKELLLVCNRNQIRRIQNAETKTRLSLLFYGIIENCEKISEHTQNLLDIFRNYLRADKGRP